MSKKLIHRRNFLKSTAILTTGITGLATMLPGIGWAKKTPTDTDINVIGPKEGFTPQIGTLISMLTWMRGPILHSTKGLTQVELDYLHDEKSNTIGAMLFHLAATERFYQIHTFEGKKWGDWSKEDKDKFGIAMALGDEGRKKIKGNNLEYYLNILKEVRENSLAEFKKRDDNWLMSVDKDWYWGPTNNYCKWFHVCEHESNHNGQIKWIKSRLPGAKKTSES